jgi:hypothetical protein
MINEETIQFYTFKLLCSANLKIFALLSNSSKYYYNTNLFTGYIKKNVLQRKV